MKTASVNSINLGPSVENLYPVTIFLMQDSISMIMI